MDPVIVILFVIFYTLFGPIIAVVLPLRQLYFGWPFTRRSMLLAVVVLGSIFGTIWLRDWPRGVHREPLYTVFGYFSPLIFIALLESKPGSSAWPGKPKDPLWVTRILLILIACFGGMERGRSNVEGHPPSTRDGRMWLCIMTANIAGVVIATGITVVAQKRAKAQASALNLPDESLGPPGPEDGMPFESFEDSTKSPHS